MLQVTTNFCFYLTSEYTNAFKKQATRSKQQLLSNNSKIQVLFEARMV